MHKLFVEKSKGFPTIYGLFLYLQNCGRKLKFSEFFFEKWPQGVLGNAKRNKVMKYELIWRVRQGVTEDHLHMGVDCAPLPCVT